MAIGWIYVVVGVLGIIAAVRTPPQEGAPLNAFGLGLVIFVAAVLGAITFMAMAELIRLALYIATLLEDIRDK